MISFWTRPLGPNDISAAARRATTMGVFAAVPHPTRACTWPRTLDLPQPVAADQVVIPPSRVEVPEVAGPWQQLGSPAMMRARHGDAEGVAEAAGPGDAWHGLVVPEERDTHFFVRSMAELQGCYGNE